MGSKQQVPDGMLIGPKNPIIEEALGDRLVVFSEAKNPPLEIRPLVGAKQEGFVGYVSLTVFARHVDSPTKLAKKVDLCLAFRHYLHYHIKAAKTNLHMRMRRKVRGWLQVLNRAALASEAPREKKTISGRTFTRK